MQNDASHTAAHLAPALKTGIWFALIIAASILFSLAFACATPFAALAAIAGSKMSRRDGLLLVLLAWASNQAIGYLVLHYPQTPDSFGWGAAIGVATLLATIVARESSDRLTDGLKGAAVAFLGAFIAYEASLYAATALLPSGDEAFSLHVILRIFEINCVAFFGLLVVHHIAMATGFLAPRSAGPVLAHHL